MGTQLVRMNILEFDNYYFAARPCVAISDQKVRELVAKADIHNLDFVGILYENIPLPDGLVYDDEISPCDEPAYIMLVRNIGAGLYRKSFVEKTHIRLDGEGELFPDIFPLWQVFTSGCRAMFVSASICESVARDTVWIDDSQAAFTVNRTYDRVRDLLMADWSLWQRWKSYYSAQRWACYYEILHWMTEPVGWQFAERMVVDFHRSYESDELDEKLFTPEEQSNFYILEKDPGFSKRFYLGKVILDKRVFDCKNEVEALKKVIDERDGMLQAQMEAYEQKLVQKQAEHDKICEKLEEERKLELEQQKHMYEASKTFRVGKAVLFIPVSIRKLVLRILKKEK